MVGKLEPLDRLTIGPFFLAGAVLQFFCGVTKAGYPAYISVQQYSCNKKAPLSGGRGQVFKTLDQLPLSSIEILSSGA